MPGWRTCPFYSRVHLNLPMIASCLKSRFRFKEYFSGDNSWAWKIPVSQEACSLEGFPSLAPGRADNRMRQHREPGEFQGLQEITSDNVALACIKCVFETHFHLFCTLPLMKNSCRLGLLYKDRSTLFEGLMIPAHLNVIKSEFINMSRQNGGKAVILAPRGL